jgi:uncharacterized protein YmfQ (DUF2313 family)
MDLMTLLPNYYIGNSSMQKLQNILSEDINSLEDGISKAIDECYVKTASKLLDRYEKIYGIKIDLSKSDIVRREKIKAKMTGTGTFTKQMLLNYLLSFAGGKAEIIEQSQNYKFRIKFNDYYRVPDSSSISEIYAITDELKPAHLAYDHTFTYDFWGNLDNTITWSETTTWDALRTYEEV